MLDILNPDELCTAGEFAARARPLLHRIAQSALPVVVGGTGLYLRALLDGLFPAPSRNDAVRERLSAREKRRHGSLHTLLRRFDPQAAPVIHPNDIPKLIRALEVYLLTRRPITSWFGEGRDALTGFRTLKIGLAPPRDLLYRRLDLRCGRMFAEGLIEEVQGILDKGWLPSAKPFESHGYRQALQILQGEMTYDHGVLEARTNTRHYAKRQVTWFRKEPDVQWLYGFGDDPRMQQAAADLLREHLSSQRLSL
jgi:tRNA dimethylallyltransferase